MATPNAPPQTSPPPITRADVLHNQQLLQERIESLIALIALQPEDSPLHNVEAYPSGIRITLLPPPNPVYIYALAWSRGWSVFVTRDTHAGPYSWRHVPKKFSHLSFPLYNKRNAIGPHHIKPNAILHPLLYIARQFKRSIACRKARQERLAADDHNSKPSQTSNV